MKNKWFCFYAEIMDSYTFTVTNDTFDMTPYKSIQWGGGKLIVKKVDNDIIVSTESLIVKPAIYFFKKDNKYVLSNNLNMVIKEFTADVIMNTDFINDMETIYNRSQHPDNTFYFRSKDIIKDGRFLTKNVTVIENYDTITLTKDGNINVINAEDKLFTVPLIDSKDLILKWHDNWMDKISKIDLLAPELSAGMDSRVLTTFWRNRSVYKVCNRPKGYINEKYDETFGRQIVELLGFEGNYTKSLDMLKVSVLRGRGTETLKENNYLMNKEFFRLQTRFLAGEYYGYICPYLDDIIPLIRIDMPNQLHIILEKMYADDLLSVPFWSFSNKPPYFIEDLPAYESAMEIYKKWGY